MIVSSSLAARFWAKVDCREADACWPWTAAVDDGGYGQISISTSKPVRATHVALALAGRPRPEGLWALHSCDNPICVNPAHLRWGTSADNIADMHNRRRQSGGSLAGTSNPKARLTEDHVRTIRASRDPGVDLAARFAVTPGLISQIRRKRIWTHI